MNFTQRVCVLSFLTTSLLGAQDLTVLRDEIGRLAAAPEGDARENALAEVRDGITKALIYDGSRTMQDALVFRRADVQNGATSGASGSTSSVLSPLLPAIFGFSFENGSITRTVSGSTVTLKANPAGLICGAGPDAAAVARRSDDACRTLWKKVGLTASFDTSRGAKNAQLDNLQAINSQFSEFTARAELINHRKASGAGYAKIYNRYLGNWRPRAQAFANAEVSVQLAFRLNGVTQKVEDALHEVVRSADWAKASEAARRQMVEDAVKKAMMGVTIEDATANRARAAWIDALKADRALQNAVANSAVLTAEYGYQQPDLATEAIGATVAKGIRPPNLHSARLIFAHGWSDRGLDLTANASASWFQEARPGMSGLFRDARAGVEGKFKLREISNYGAPTLSFAALYVYLHQRPLGLGITAFNQAGINEPGHIGVFQTKLEFPTANNAIRIPVSFTYSNRTELIRESEVRGQVGVSFNLDALFVEKK